MCFLYLSIEFDANQKYYILIIHDVIINVFLSDNFGQEKTASLSFGELEAVESLDG